MKPSRAGLEKLFNSHTQALLNASSITLHTRSLAERGKEDTMILSRDHDLYWSFLFPWSLQREKVLSCQGQTFDVGIGSWQHPAVFCSWIFVSWRQFMISLSKEMLIRMVFQVKCQHSQIIFLQLDLCGFSATGRQTFWDWSLGNFRSFRGTYVLQGWECWICSTSLRSCGGSSGPSSPGFRSRWMSWCHVWMRWLAAEKGVALPLCKRSTSRLLDYVVFDVFVRKFRNCNLVQYERHGIMLAFLEL